MSHLLRLLPSLCVAAVLAATSSQGLASGRHTHQHERKTESDAKGDHKSASKKADSKKSDSKKADSKKADKAASKKAGKGEHAEHVKRGKKASSDEKPAEATAPALTGDLAVVKNAINLAREGKTGDATAVEKTIADPAGQKLAEWFILRHPGSGASFSRYASFIADNTDWPGISLLRRRAEALLWQDRADAATVHSFTQDHPLTAKGRLALARVLLEEGDRSAAQRLVRETWRLEDLSERSESDLLDSFRDLLTPGDYLARMEKRIGAKDFAAAMRAAHHVGDDAVSIVKACAAVKGGDKKAPDLLDSVSTEGRQGLAYVLCRAQYLMHKDNIADAARLVLEAPATTMAYQDTDEWWRVRRTLSRKLMDQGDFKVAYRMVSEAAEPNNDNYRAEYYFMPGWIALRYLNDPKTALAHFAHIDEGCDNPITRARAGYWRGRAAEALGDRAGMLAGFEAAARYSTAYYGQLARARLGMPGIELRKPASDPGAPKAEIVSAADMLYAVGERDTVVSFVVDLAEDSTDVATLSGVADVTARHNDARAMLELGKTALGRGLALDTYAFPTIGIPPHSPLGPAIEPSVIYAVARTESDFNQRDRSSADAVGLLQVTPEAGRDTAKRLGVEYDWDRLVSDPVYNTQMGAAELSALMQDYRGSHIMTFAGYNAGRGRVRDWVKAYGDPRDPNVDAVDWVERIPFAETRNYVQRVMENLAVYRARFGAAEVATSGASETTHEATATPSR